MGGLREACDIEEVSRNIIMHSSDFELSSCYFAFSQDYPIIKNSEASKEKRVTLTRVDKEGSKCRGKNPCPPHYHLYDNPFFIIRESGLYPRPSFLYLSLCLIAAAIIPTFLSSSTIFIMSLHLFFNTWFWPLRLEVTTFFISTTIEKAHFLQISMISSWSHCSQSESTINQSLPRCWARATALRQTRWDVSLRHS